MVLELFGVALSIPGVFEFICVTIIIERNIDIERGFVSGISLVWIEDEWQDETEHCLYQKY